MALRRYNRVPILNVNKQYGTSFVSKVINAGIENGTIRFTEDFLHEGERLDSIAGRVYGRADLYWVIAAASKIGWALQVPPNTVLKIPHLSDIAKLVG